MPATRYPTRATVPLPPAVGRILGSRRKTCTVVAYNDSEYPQVTCSGTYWDGGSRSEYFDMRPEVKTIHSIPCPSAPPPFSSASTPVVDVHPGHIVAQASTFRGKSGFLTFTGRRCDLTALGLTVPAEG